MSNIFIIKTMNKESTLFSVSQRKGAGGCEPLEAEIAEVPLGVGC